MKKQFLSALFLFISIGIWAQSDNCSSATVITPTATCSSPVSGTTIGATQSIPGCSGTADDDVWYQFTATATAHEITVVPSASMDPVVQLFSGPCASLVSLVCKDNGANGTTETINYSGLTIGNVYTIRVYHYGTGAGSGTFTICVADAPIAPSNDDCAGATPLNVNSTCVSTLGTTNGASQSQAGCAGNADDDVWYSFVATNSLQTIQVNPLSNIDLVFQVFSGSCGSLSSLACIDNTFTAQAEQTDVVGLVAGQTYFVRVYDYYGGNTGDFEICVVGDPTPVPSNDDPCSAILLPEVTATCQYSQFKSARIWQLASFVVWLGFVLTHSKLKEKNENISNKKIPTSKEIGIEYLSTLLLVSERTFFFDTSRFSSSFAEVENTCATNVTFLVNLDALNKWRVHWEDTLNTNVS